MTYKCRFCGGKLIPGEGIRGQWNKIPCHYTYSCQIYWYICPDCKATGPVNSDQTDALAAMVGDGNEKQLIETNYELNCRVVELKKNNSQLDKWNTEKVDQIDSLNDTIRILRTRNKILTPIPKKKNWPEGVIVVDEERAAKPSEAGRYRYWNKTQNDNSPYFITMSVGTIFHPSLIYKKLSAEELILREKPVKQ